MTDKTLAAGVDAARAALAAIDAAIDADRAAARAAIDAAVAAVAADYAARAAIATGETTESNVSFLAPRSTADVVKNCPSYVIVGTGIAKLSETAGPPRCFGTYLDIEYAQQLAEDLWLSSANWNETAQRNRYTYTVVPIHTIDPRDVVA